MAWRTSVVAPGADTGTTPPSPTTPPADSTTPLDATNPTGDGSTDAPIVDAGRDACTSTATIPPDDVCTRYLSLACVAMPEAGFFTQDECRKLCSGKDGGDTVFCNVQRDAKDEPYLACTSCVIGRRPEGLESVDRASGPAIGAYFADTSHLEAASVDAFLTLGAELSSLGAPRSLATRARRAARDEVHHARVTGRLARRFGAKRGAWTEPPRVTPRPAPRTLEQIATENAVEGCVRETFGALVGMWQAEHAADPKVRAAMRVIAEDELRHAALAWSVATWSRSRLDAEANARVDDATRDAIDHLSRDMATEPPEELVDHVGLLTARAAEALIRSLDAAVWSGVTGPV